MRIIKSYEVKIAHRIIEEVDPAEPRTNPIHFTSPCQYKLRNLGG